MYKTEELQNFKLVEPEDYNIMIDNKGTLVPSVLKSTERSYYLDDTLIGSGGYGMVFRYISEDRYSVMLKLFTNPKADTCLDTSEYLPGAKCPGGKYVLKQRCITPKSLPKKFFRFVIMENMDGDIASMNLKEVTSSQKITMCINVISGIQCLQSKDKKRNYIDIKPANILFKVTEKEQVEVCVGDLEVCSPYSQISTYRPPREWAGDCYSCGCYEYVSVWGIMLLVLWLFKSSGKRTSDPYYIHGGGRIKTKKVVKLQKLVCRMPKLKKRNDDTKKIIDTFQACLGNDPATATFDNLRQTLVNYKKLIDNK